MVFFIKHLSDLVREDGTKPLTMPALYTINDFFYKVAGVGVTDRVTLLLKLYSCYKALNPKAEPLDEFIFWGDILLSDFDDVDKYLADPQKLFTNVVDFKELTEDIGEYMDQSQVDAIKAFVSHFKDKDGKLTVNLGGDDVKAKFLQIWDILYPLYKSYNETLKSSGMAYEGMVYRNLASRLENESASDILSEVFPLSSKFVFVGLNALNNCEKTVLRKMNKAQLAEFCWDYSGDMIKDRLNKSSFFMAENVIEFPQAMEFDSKGLVVPEINIISVPSSVGQAKQIPQILSQSGDPNDFAVVLPDESLLVPVLNSIPKDVKDINVTMGYPMSSSVMFSFMNIISSLQIHTRKKGEGFLFHYSQVRALYLNSIFSKVLDEDGKAILKGILDQGKFYIPQSDFEVHPLLKLVFTTVVLDPKSDSVEQIRRIQQYQKDVITAIAPRLKDDPDMSMELDFAKGYYQSINVLEKEDLPIQPVTYFSLLSSLLNGISVPFKGEPLKGLQIMGPLETRALDFSTLVILSANEGIFPRRSVSSSFIPHELRKGFDLPTYEYQDAVWAYYFYRMICRAKSVWMLFDSRTEGLKSGEESRYIKQLEYHFGLKLKRFYAQASATAVEVENDDIPKKPEDIEKIKKLNLSASALKNYLSCPAKFYYHSVQRLKPEEELSEEMDASMIGNVFHETMQALYIGDKAMDPLFDMSNDDEVRKAGHMEVVTEEYINLWLSKEREGALKARIRSLMLSQLNTLEITGRNLVVEDVILSYVHKTLKRDIEHMHDNGVTSFKVLGLERKYSWELDGFKFNGTVDRLDSFTPGVVRIVDYKTGKVEKSDVDINDDNAADIAEAMFGDDNTKRPSIAFQLFLYDKFVQDDDLKNGKEGLRYANSIYSVAKLFTDKILDVPVNESFNKDVQGHLSKMLADLVNPGVSFTRTDDRKTCSYCDFKMICGR
ncbi:MAG: PD-(D/E)XK nuclease family protein [Bacteroidales bacterium]|nr:PD-(D/E)XK nuclease family protein [Bacteroidales bacterium]